MVKVTKTAETGHYLVIGRTTSRAVFMGYGARKQAQAYADWVNGLTG